MDEALNCIHSMVVATLCYRNGRLFSKDMTGADQVLTLIRYSALSAKSGPEGQGQEDHVQQEWRND